MLKIEQWFTSEKHNFFIEEIKKIAFKVEVLIKECN